MSLFLGIDLGTTYFKAGLWDAAGRQCGLGRAPVPKISRGSRCELPIEAFWEALRALEPECVERLGDIVRNGKPSEATIAIQIVFDRLYGKPVQATDVNMDVSGGLDVRAQIHAALLAQAAETQNGGG